LNVDVGRKEDGSRTEVWITHETVKVGTSKVPVVENVRHRVGRQKKDKGSATNRYTTRGLQGERGWSDYHERRGDSARLRVVKPVTKEQTHRPEDDGTGTEA